VPTLDPSHSAFSALPFRPACPIGRDAPDGPVSYDRECQSCVAEIGEHIRRACRRVGGPGQTLNHDSTVIQSLRAEDFAISRRWSASLAYPRRVPGTSCLRVVDRQQRGPLPPSFGALAVNFSLGRRRTIRAIRDLADALHGGDRHRVDSLVRTRELRHTCPLRRGGHVSVGAGDGWYRDVLRG